MQAPTSPTVVTDSNRATIADRWMVDDADRQSILDEARICAALTKPWVLPPREQQPDRSLPENFQSIGSRGMTNLEGRMLMALYPPNAPWFRLQVSANRRYSPFMPVALLQSIEQRLYVRELVIQATLESVHLTPGENRMASNFRSRKRGAISQVLITGDVLEQLDDQYRLKVFRRDQYVTRRDSSTNVLYHIVRECIDPLTLNEAMTKSAGLDRAELAKKTSAARMMDLYTMIEWNPVSKVWIITQEINGKKINESEETVSPYFATSFELVAGENYGRGFAAQNLGDLRSLDDLCRRELDAAAAASKITPVLDYSAEMREEDLEKKSGVAIRGKVQAGQVQDAALWKTDKGNDFAFLGRAIARVEANLGKAFLLESETAPQGERVTKYQVQRVALELEGALGGVYAPIADEQQIPLLQRTIHQLERDKALAPLPRDFAEIRGLTGIAALSRESDAARLMEIVQVVSMLSPEARMKIDESVLVDVMARYRRIDEPGLIKSTEQLQAERQEALRLQSAAQANEKAIDVIGNVAESRLSQAQAA